MYGKQFFLKLLFVFSDPVHLLPMAIGQGLHSDTCPLNDTQYRITDISSSQVILLVIPPLLFCFSYRPQRLYIGLGCCCKFELSSVLSPNLTPLLNNLAIPACL
jgi:hypothetical protein